MSKAKPCPKVVDGHECGRPKMKGKQSCQWHWLLRQSSDVQAAAARQRLADHGGEVTARIPASGCPEGERWCAGCQTMIPKFYASGSRCKACVSSAAHARRLESTYGIDKAEYDRILKLQGGRCAICRNRPASKRFAVDHDHKSGEVRGILCKRCNHDLLGGAHDGVAMLWRAIQYLLFPPAQKGRAAAPTPGEVVSALRSELERAEAEGRRPAVEPQEPPF